MVTLECVPNVSEAIHKDVVAACAAAIAGTGAALLDVHGDVAHNRSVFTFAGSPADVVAGAEALVATALARVDLSTHAGVHPRVGAVDVVPFVPLGDLTMDECVRMAQAFARVVAERHDLPVFLYEEAALVADRRRLEVIRRGGLDALAGRMATAGWEPDFGPRRPHPTAGVTVVGARMPLIAYNVNLATADLGAARAIARVVRESSGGLPCVKALGLLLDDRAMAQVSMNLTNFHVTPVRRVYDAVCAEARRLGVEILESELVGLVPAAAMSDADARYMRIRGFDGSQILERRLAAHR